MYFFYFEIIFFVDDVQDPTFDALKLEDIDDQNAIRNLSRTTSVESVFSLDKVSKNIRDGIMGCMKMLLIVAILR